MLHRRVKQHFGLKESWDINVFVSRAWKIHLFQHSLKDDFGWDLDDVYGVAAME
jgi:hypothetical protein